MNVLSSLFMVICEAILKFDERVIYFLVVEGLYSGCYINHYAFPGRVRASNNA